MDKELHHTRGALHMEAFTDAQMWGFSEQTADERLNKRDQRTSSLHFFYGLGSLKAQLTHQKPVTPCCVYHTQIAMCSCSVGVISNPNVVQCRSEE